MRNNFTFPVAIVILAILLAYSVTYQVRFDQVAVVTRFGRATEGSIKNVGDADDSGIHFKFPYPVDSVRVYDKRVQVLDDRPEEQQTNDNVSIVVQSYLAWRITDPLHFYRALGTVDEAEKQLRSKLRDARKVLGDRFTFEDLTNTDPAKLKLREVEEAILQRMRRDLTTASQPYGIELQSVGIKRILLAPKTTEEVFNRMKSTRQRMAEGYRQEGESRADQIKAEAESRSKIILAFADSRAQVIRTEGENEATKYLATFAEDEDLAIYLRRIDFYKKMFSDSAQGKTTFIINVEDDPFLKTLFKPVTGATAPPTAAAE